MPESLGNLRNLPLSVGNNGRKVAEIYTQNFVRFVNRHAAFGLKLTHDHTRHGEDIVVPQI